MRSEKYRLSNSCFAIQSTPDGKRIPVNIPADSTVTVVNGPLDGTRMVEVDWDGDIVLMFTAELRESGTLVGPPAVAQHDGKAADGSGKI